MVPFFALLFFGRPFQVTPPPQERVMQLFPEKPNKEGTNEETTSGQADGHGLPHPHPGCVRGGSHLPPGETREAPRLPRAAFRANARSAHSDLGVCQSWGAPKMGFGFFWFPTNPEAVIKKDKTHPFCCWFLRWLERCKDFELLLLDNEETLVYFQVEGEEKRKEGKAQIDRNLDLER